jgi:Flp pilus assembly protein TadD
VETQVRDGQLDEATALLEEQLTARPNDPSLRFLRAGLYFLEDDRARAEEEYKKLLEQFPGNDRVLRTYYSLLIAEGRDAEAGALVDKVIAERPDASSALLLKAERLEKAQDFEGAIAIYEDLYAKNSNSVILANNLASLITTHRTDPESLERGFAIASRLRGSTFPPLQDTYGWIEYRRGNYEEALTYLEPAAAGLPEDPLVQYHLGMTYVALERTEDARETLTRALEIAGDMPLPQFDVAREALSKLPAPE